jgi:ATP-binding cassette, subfamily C, bacterial
MNDAQPPRHKRAQTPTLLQMEAVECGAAALGIILRYHGRYAGLEELRNACYVSRDGSTALNIVQAARSYGLEARGLRRRQLNALRKIAPPFIAYWGFNHFLVVEKVGTERENKVWLNDPATGPRTVTLAEFGRMYTGIIITATPSADFRQGGQRFKLLAALNDRLGRSRMGVLFVILASLFLLVPGLVVPGFLRVFVDFVLIGDQAQTVLLPLLLGFGLALVLQTLLGWLQAAYLLRLQTKLALNLSARFFWHVLHLPLTFFTQRYAGDIAYRVQLNDSVAGLLSGELAANVINLFLIVFYALLMLQYDVLLTLLGVSLALVNIVVLQIVSRARADANLRYLQESSKLVGTATNGLNIIETLKSTSGESDFFTRWAGFQAKKLNSEQDLKRITLILSLVPPFIQALITALVLVVGGLRVLDGALTIGMLVAFQSLMLAFSGPIQQFTTLAQRLQTASGDLSRLDDVLNYPRDPHTTTTSGANPVGTPAGASANTSDTARRALGLARQTPTRTDVTNVRADAIHGVPTLAGGPQKLDGYLELRDVTFGYNALGDPLISRLNLTLTPGQRVALVGGSGSGKSTVAKLVAGLYQPWSGEILFDGQPRASIPRDVMAASVALVSQEIVLFSGSIRENLTLWNASIPQRDVVQAAKDAQIHETITARPGNYNAVLEEGGGNFSGGERQRLEIARALAGNPALLIMDEATSALDPITEQRIDDHLRRRGCTCLIVAHRLSTIRDCDEIIVLQGGQVVQRGTHDEMSKYPGPYAELLGIQTQPDEGDLLDSLLGDLL